MIKQAIDAMDKATPGPWGKSKWNLLKWDGYIQRHIKTKSDEYDNDIARICDQGNNDTTSANADLCAAAPSMAAWIKKALPFLRLSKHVHIPETRPELINDPWDDALDALIQEATK